MSFKREVLYQKWRPKNFSDVMGQDHITTTLKNSLRIEMLMHIYLRVQEVLEKLQLLEYWRKLLI